MSQRMLHGLSFIVVCLLMAIALFLQNSEGILPCPLCILQRYVFALLAGIFFIAWIVPWRKRGNQVLGILGMVICLLGAALAGRQVWLQHFPPQGNGECSLSLSYLLQTFSWQEALRKIMEGGTECAETTWRLLSLSLAEWSFLAFLGFFCLSLYQLKHPSRKK